MSDAQLSSGAKRLLVAIYRLAGGRTDVEVSREQIDQEFTREALDDCTDEQFAAYHRRVMAEVDAANAPRGAA